MADIGGTDRSKLYRFRIDKILGRGGSGTVYRGLDPDTSEVVALKLFRANFFASRSHQKDFAKSVGSFKKFKHANVVQIREFISGDEGDCLVMEYVDGPDLRWYMENRPWNLHERLVIVVQICNGLQYIHEQGFTHHDLKPANILFTRKGVAKLTDFSLAKGAGFSLFSTMHPELITPMFIAPELIAKQKATPQSDIYSLGITMYILFTGRTPFQVDTLQKLYHCHQKSMPDHPTMASPKCPQRLGDIIMKMLSKKPETRYADCDQLRIVLSEIGRSQI